MKRNNTEPFPQECSLVAHLCGRLFMYVAGWKVRGEVAKSNKMVIIAAPHTSNWDLVFLLAAAFILGMKIQWLGKKELFFPLFGSILRFLGGIPVERDHATNAVKKLVTEIAQVEAIALVIPPTGTRSKTNYWRSGFYWISYESSIPIVCGYLDYAKKEAGLGLSFVPSGQVKQDMDKIREFYSNISARYPDKMGPVRLKEEDASAVL